MHDLPVILRPTTCIDLEKGEKPWFPSSIPNQKPILNIGSEVQSQKNYRNCLNLREKYSVFCFPFQKKTWIWNIGITALTEMKSNP